MWICAGILKISKFHLFILESILESREQIGHTIFDHSQPKKFRLTFNFCNLYQHAKNQAFSLICFGEMVDLKVLKSDWLRPFWTISPNKTFPKYRICARTEEIRQIFIIEHILWKLLIEFFFKFKKPCFWLISPILEGKQRFLRHPALLYTTW